MKTRNFYYSICILSILIFLTSACGQQDATDKETVKEDSLIPVETQVIKAREISRSIEYTGTIQAFEENHIGAASPMRIKKIYVDVGDKVRKGALLVQMDKTQLNQAKIQYENAKVELQRLDTLLKVGSVSQQQYDQMETQYEIAKTSYENLMENTQLRSPISGIITGKHQNDGEVYTMSPNPATGKAAIVSIMQITPVKVLVDIPESYFPEVSKDQEVYVKVDIFKGETFKGKVYKIHPTIDKATRTFTVEVTIPNKDKRLRPGMFCRVELEFGKIQAVVAPAISILKQSGSNERYAFVIEGNTANRRTVNIGKRFNEFLEITSGLKSGDELVISGQKKLLDQSTVKVVK